MLHLGYDSSTITILPVSSAASKIESSSSGDNVRKSSTVAVLPSFFNVLATLLQYQQFAP